MLFSRKRCEEPVCSLLVETVALENSEAYAQIMLLPEIIKCEECHFSELMQRTDSFATKGIIINICKRKLAPDKS